MTYLFLKDFLHSKKLDYENSNYLNYIKLIINSETSTSAVTSITLPTVNVQKHSIYKCDAKIYIIICGNVYTKIQVEYCFE